MNIIFDTNILLNSPEILEEKIKEFNIKIIIPFVILKELDNHKYKSNGFLARKAIREIAKLIKKYPNKIILDDNYFNNDNLLLEKDNNLINNNNNLKNDLEILNVAKKYNAIIYTQDISLSIIAKSFNIKVEILKFYNEEEIFTPEIELSTSKSLETIFKNINPFQKVYNGKDLIKINKNIKDFNLFGNNKDLIRDGSQRYIILRNDIDNKKVDYIYIYNPKEKILEEINLNKKYSLIESSMFKLNAKDEYQKIAIYVLNNAPNVLILGKYGSGKSLLTTAYAIANSDNRKILISRPNIGLDSRFEIGYLPGDKNEKLIEYKSGFLSALYYLFGNTRGQKENGITYDFVKEELFYRYFEILPLNMIQGNSILDMFYIVDEVQFINISYMTMILSRIAEGSKLIMTGDLNQNYDVIKPSESALLKLLKIFNMDYKYFKNLNVSKDFKSELAIVNLKNQYRSKLTEIAEVLQKLYI